MTAVITGRLIITGTCGITTFWHVGALAQWFMYRWDLAGETPPDFRTELRGTGRSELQHD
jgi:hypothetical protein